MEFFKHLDSDLKTALKAQLRDLWTHTSTALEGNTLTLGETKFVIEEGLTVSGKPLADHQEVVGHARAIELIYVMVGKTEIEDSDLFELHKAVITQVVVDIYKPVGGWKKEPNGTYFFNEETHDKEFIKHGESLDEFKAFCLEHWTNSLDLVNRAHQRQLDRNEAAGKAQGADRGLDKYR